MSISFHPVNIRLEFGFWSTGIFICLSAGSTLTILVWAINPWNVSKQFTQPARKTHESAVTEVWILGIRKQTQTRRILSLSVREKANGVNNSQKNFVLILGAFVLWDKASWAIMDYGHCAE